jgi:Protein of unknown function (DUF2480)
MEEQLINRVANSGLVTIDLEQFYPSGEIVTFDMKDYLFHGLILKEKDFRESLKNIDWNQYQAKHLAIFCSSDAIIPTWAFQLVVIYAEPFATGIAFGDPSQYLQQYYPKILATLPLDTYIDQRIVIKGCSNRPVPTAAYIELTRLLRPIAKSIMFGEPCSTVPLYKKT